MKNVNPTSNSEDFTSEGPMGSFTRKLKKPGPAQFAYLLSGFLILVAVAYLDNIRGPLLPVLCEVLQIPYTYAGLFLTVGNFSAVLSTFALGYFLKRYSERRVTLCICLIALIPGIFAPFVGGVIGLILLGAIIGCLVALFGAMSSILTIKGSPASLRGKILSAQQVMYGVGSLLAPLAFAEANQRAWPWWSGLGFASIGFLTLFILFRLSLPEDPPFPQSVEGQKTKPKGVELLAILIFGSYVGGEALASMWMTTYMVNQSQISPEQAAQIVGGFFLVLATTRLLSFIFVKPQFEKFVIISCLTLGICSLLLAQQGQNWAFAAVGFLGPFFPLFMAEISQKFFAKWKDLTIWIYVSIQTSLGLIHITVGNITDHLGIEIAFLISPALIFLSLIGYLIFQNRISTTIKSGNLGVQ